VRGEQVLDRAVLARGPRWRARHPPPFESLERPGEKLTVDEYYRFIFERSVPGLPERAAQEGITPLEYMRRYGAFEIARGVGPRHEQPVPAAELDDTAVDPFGWVYTRAAAPAPVNAVPLPTPDPDGDGRRAAGVLVDGDVLRGFPTPSGRLEFYSCTLAEWGWPEPSAFSPARARGTRRSGSNARRGGRAHGQAVRGREPPRPHVFRRSRPSR
jgi:hypothetical protein